MQCVKTLVDELNVLGKKMDQEDITDAILTGLDTTTYKPIIESVHARDTPISFHELHEKLINNELSLIQNSSPQSNLHQPTTAFAANKRPPQRTWNNNRPFNNPILPTPQQAQGTYNNSPLTLPSLPRTSYSNTSPQAHAMNTTNNSDSTWLFDSGASHHITSDLNALSLHTPYDGTDELVIGDGSSLLITHVGSLLLKFSTSTFKLKNVLCVPSISKHMLTLPEDTSNKFSIASIRVTHINGDDQLADALTKPLLHQRFHLLVSKIGLTSRSSILREHINT
ncbi:hypothetical protein LXL04_007487 [Taraxacum kok-saghyz]